MRNAEEQAPRLVIEATELLAAGTDGRRVDDGQKLFQVPDQRRVEQGLVDVLQFAQEGITFEIGLELAQRLEGTGDLLVQGRDVRRQQAVEMEGVALFLGEGRALV